MCVWLRNKQSTATASPMKTSSSSTPRRACSPWPMPARTPTARSSSSPPPSPRTSHSPFPAKKLSFLSGPINIPTNLASVAGWTASTSSSARSLRATILSTRSRTSKRALATSPRRPSRSSRAGSCLCPKKVSTWNSRVCCSTPTPPHETTTTASAEIHIPAHCISRHTCCLSRKKEIKPREDNEYVILISPPKRHRPPPVLSRPAPLMSLGHCVVSSPLLIRHLSCPL